MNKSDDIISRKAAIDAMCELMCHWFGDNPKDEIREIKRELEKLPSTQRWIPISEGLPEIDMGYPHHDDYLVQYDSGCMDVASWSNVNRFWTDHITEPYWNCVQFAKVVAWMPLPEHWKGENNEHTN